MFIVGVSLSGYIVDSVQRFFIQLSYDGSPYCGWQIQPNARSVQGCIEEALGVLMRHPVSVVGCGRTDAGVNASCYYAHFDLEEPVSLEKRKPWAYQMNALLDKEISIHSIFEVDPSLHARFSATSRTYHYYIHTRKDPFLDRFSYFCRFPIREELISLAASQLCRYKDFTSFSKLHTQTKTNLCDLTQSVFEPVDHYRWCFTFTANRFLRNMVRAMVGTLLDIGSGRCSLDGLDEIMMAKDRGRAGVSVPGHALFLSNVTYL